MTTIDVCIPTYKRPKELRALLSSLEDQRLEEGTSFRVIIVDNDFQASARPVAESFASSKIPVVYEVEPTKNISLARNRCLSRVTSELIAFIDDDEAADPSWLFELKRTLMTFDVDIVHGPVFPIFEEGTSRFWSESRAFERPNPATGAAKGYVRNTGNCLMRSSLVLEKCLTFNPAFGMTGGEDTEFFLRAQKLGARFAWAQGAVARERVPKKRAQLGWFLKRSFRSGGTHLKVNAEKSNLIPGVIRGIAALLALIALPLVIVPLCFFKSRLIRLLRLVAFNFGSLAFALGFERQEYR